MLRLGSRRQRRVDESLFEAGVVVREHQADQDDSKWPKNQHKRLKYASSLLSHERRSSDLAINGAPQGKQNKNETNAPGECRNQVLERVRRDCDALETVGVEYRDDPKIVLAAVQQKGMLLRHASPRLRKKRAIVEEAVKQDGLAIIYASQDKRADPRIISLAVQQHGFALLLAEKEFRNDRTLVLRAAQESWLLLTSVPDHFLDDPEIVAAAISSANPSQKKLGNSLVLRLFGTKIRERLVSAVKGMHRRDIPDAELFQGSAVEHYAKHVLKHCAQAKLWLLREALPPNMALEQEMMIVEYSGVSDDIKLANELIALAPVFAAFFDQGVRWKDLPKLLDENV